MNDHDHSDLGSVNVSQSPLERFTEYLRKEGKRVTNPRRVITEEVFRRHTHFDAEELIGDLKQGGKEGSRATVYRTLKELVDAGLLREVTLTDRRSVYEHDYGYPQHDHLHCEECGRLFEFDSEPVRQFRDAVARELGFRVTGHRLIISGVCQECIQAQRRKVRRLDLV